MELPLASLAQMRVAQLTAEDRAIFNRFPPGHEYCCRMDDRTDAINTTASLRYFGSVVDAVLRENGGSRILREGRSYDPRQAAQIAIDNEVRRFEMRRAARTRGGSAATRERVL